MNCSTKCCSGQFGEDIALRTEREFGKPYCVVCAVQKYKAIQDVREREEHLALLQRNGSEF